jgi:hypothetical protein
MTRAADPPLRLRGQRQGVIRSLVLPPAGIAALALALEAAVRGRVALDTLVFAGAMLMIAFLALLHDTMRHVLVVDDTGVCWARGLRRRVYRWSDIQEVGVVRLAAAGWRCPSPSGTIAGAPHSRSVTHIALRLAPGRSHGPRGQSGLKVILPNDFGPTEELDRELRRRWRRHLAQRQSLDLPGAEECSGVKPAPEARPGRPIAP